MLIPTCPAWVKADTWENMTKCKIHVTKCSKRRQYSCCPKGHWVKNEEFPDHVKAEEAADAEEEEKVCRAKRERFKNWCPNQQQSN